jgi:hypothetical protein
MDGIGGALTEGPGFRTETNRDEDSSATVRLRGELDIVSAGAARRALEQLDVGIQADRRRCATPWGKIPSSLA